jgi:hypothetical protein
MELYVDALHFITLVWWPNSGVGDGQHVLKGYMALDHPKAVSRMKNGSAMPLTIFVALMYNNNITATRQFRCFYSVVLYVFGE